MTDDMRRDIDRARETFSAPFIDETPLVRRLCDYVEALDAGRVTDRNLIQLLGWELTRHSAHGSWWNDSAMWSLIRAVGSYLGHPNFCGDYYRPPNASASGLAEHMK